MRKDLDDVHMIPMARLHGIVVGTSSPPLCSGCSWKAGDRNGRNPHEAWGNMENRNMSHEQNRGLLPHASA